MRVVNLGVCPDGDCGTRETACDGVNEADVPGYGISDDGGGG